MTGRCFQSSRSGWKCRLAVSPRIDDTTVGSVNSTRAKGLNEKGQFLSEIERVFFNLKTVTELVVL